VNLSDLAAKGAAPAGCVLTLALRGAEESWLMRFAQALGEDCTRYRCPLLGGDTVSTPGPLMISVTAFGRVPAGKMVRRNGARPGDLVLVTGTIGDAALGLDVLRGGNTTSAVDAAAREFLIGRYRVPQPRVAVASAVREYAHAAMDVSDGLAGDLAKLCKVSGVSAVIEAERIPLSHAASPLVACGVVGIGTIVAGGDDYEVLCTLPHDRLEVFRKAAEIADIAVAVIGTIVEGASSPRFLDQRGEEIVLRRLSYSHF
jgi:thiamine-monophosphate kinase